MALRRENGEEYEPSLLVMGGLLIGIGLFLGGYASLSNPIASVFTIAFLLSGVLFSEAISSDKPILYVLSSTILAITVGCCLLAMDVKALLAGAFCVSGPIVVAKGLRKALRAKATPV